MEGKHIKKKNEKRSDIAIARQLLYPKSVIEALQHEPDPDRRKKILHDARQNSMSF